MQFTEKAFAFGAVNACSSPTRLRIRPIVSPEEFRRGKANKNQYLLGSERENAARFERFLATPEAKSVAGRYYLGFPDTMEIMVGTPAALKRDDKGKLVPVDEDGKQVLENLDGYQGPDDVKANKKGMEMFLEWETSALKVKQGIQRVLLAVAMGEPHKACAVEVEHLDGEHLIGGFTFVFRPDDETAPQQKGGCL